MRNMTIITVVSLLMICYLGAQDNCFPDKQSPFANRTKKSDPVAQPVRGVQQWRPIQEKVRDTVIQVFSVVAEFNWLQPYSTPNQYMARGSGFFISKDGDIITNAHVVDQAVNIWIQIPSLGKRPLQAFIVGICPEQDLALLRVHTDDLAYIRDALGSIPYLTFGDSDQVLRSDEVLALGYPLGQESLKSTNGIVSGREQDFIQMSAAINPGSSGGPVFNMNGEVIGICSASITEAQNIGYAIPSKTLELILPDLYKIPFLRKPYLGILSIKVTDNLTDYLGNPQPGGCYVLEVVKDSPLEKAGIQAEDMIYEINDYRLDIYGEINVDWSEEKVSFADYITRLPMGKEINLVVYRRGERIEKRLKLNLSEVTTIRKYYPWHEKIDYEVFAGMVVMALTLNHIKILEDQVAGLKAYTVINKKTEPVLIISHIFPNSELAQSRAISIGFTLNEINGESVKTLDDFRSAIKKSVKTGNIVIKAVDQVSWASDNMIAVLSLDKILKEITEHSQLYRYPISETVQWVLDQTQTKTSEG